MTCVDLVLWSYFLNTPKLLVYEPHLLTLVWSAPAVRCGVRCSVRMSRQVQCQDVTSGGHVRMSRQVVTSGCHVRLSRQVVTSGGHVRL